MSRGSALTLGVAFTVLVAACGDDCELVACPAVACMEPFTLIVTDAVTSMPLDGASATGDVQCSTAPSGVACAAGGAGVFHVTVSAPGFASSQVVVTVQPGVAGTACSCSRCATWQPTSVALARQ